MELFRPTGLQEMLLVLRRDLAAWPPRLPEQPIFYPVLNRDYAEQIARDWNTKADAQVGYVTRFEVDDHYVSRFERRVVGGQKHQELWVPADELEEFNRHIRAPIRVISAFFGANFRGLIPFAGALRDKDAREQLDVLAEQYAHSRADFHQEIRTNNEAVFLHLLFWRALGLSTNRLPASPDQVLPALQQAWLQLFPSLPLPEINT
jgi:hypothetical protein